MKRLLDIHDIINFLEIDPQVGTAGMPTIDQFQSIAAAGYEVVINLALDQSPGAIPEEEALVTRYGIHYIHIPVVWEYPQQADLEQFFTAMQKWHGHKIFVHCVLNMRVAVFVYLYRVIILQEDSLCPFQDLLKIWQPDQTWQTLIDDALNKTDWNNIPNH